MAQTLIFDTKKYAINDGPGIRLTVFFKGCPLSCWWCHNPESISPKEERMYNASKCIGAKDCIELCPNQSLSLTKEGIKTNADLCALCGACAKACPSKAFEMLGEYISVSDLMKTIDAEAIFFDQSGGGVTFSGGEPLMHSEYLIEALKACGDRMYHRVVDTSAFAKQSVLLEVAKHTELFLIDIKSMNDEIYQKYTGVSNRIILENIKALANNGSEMCFRLPLIEGVNADEDNILKTAEFIKDLGINKPVIHILPYHNIAENKYHKLGVDENFVAFKAPSDERIELIIHQFKQHNIEAIIGG
jgi:pyruvate formate lyase activating enzyme